MPAALATSAPAISPGEMQLLLSRTGLVLNPGQVADLVLAWRQLEGLVAAMPHDRPLADDMASVFRLPPPPSAAASAPASQPTKKSKSAPKPKAKAKAKPRAKPAPKRGAVRRAPGKRARRGR